MTETPQQRAQRLARERAALQRDLNAALAPRRRAPLSADAEDRRRYTIAGTALYHWLHEGVERLPVDAYGDDELGQRVRRSTQHAVDELSANYRRGRELWQAGSHHAAAQLMTDSAVIAVRLEQDLRTHARRIPALARWLSSGSMRQLTAALRSAANAALEPLNELARGAGLGIGVAVVLIGGGVAAAAYARRAHRG